MAIKTVAMVKIFGIGLQRTGTTSLYHALNLLGVRAAPNAIPLFTNLDDPILDAYDAFCDNPIPLLVRQLDGRFPGSKFILTTRPLPDWLRSVEWLFTVGLQELSPELRQTADAIHLALYGRTTFETAVFTQFWRDYHAQVAAHFANRPADLLTLDFSRGDGWPQLCAFLNRPEPAVPFPNRNQSSRRRSLRLRWQAWRQKRNTD